MRRAFPALFVLTLALTIPQSGQAGGEKLDRKLLGQLKESIGKLSKLPDTARRKDPVCKEAVRVLAAIAKANNEAAAKALIKVALMSFRSHAAEVKMLENIQEMLSEMKSKEAQEAVIGQLKKTKKRSVQMVLLAVVAKYKESDSAQFALHEVLLGKKTHDLVVAETARVLAERMDKRGVKPLIEAFGKYKKEGGATFFAIRKALHALTGKSFMEVEEWTSFWDPREATFNPRTANRPPMTTTSERKKAPKLFGSEVVSRKVVVIIDVSYSMHIKDAPSGKYEEPDDLNPGGGGAGSVARGQPKPGKGGRNNPANPNYQPGPCKYPKCPQKNGHDGNLPDYRMRIERAKRELQRLVYALPADTRFNIVKFSTKAAGWKRGKIVGASSGNKGSAVGFIKNLKPEGVTMAYKALVEAFKCKDADTFYFISDGAPTDTEGQVLKLADKQSLLDKVAQLNKFRKVRINTIGLKGASYTFMFKLASMTGGSYKQVD